MQASLEARLEDHRVPGASIAVFRDGELLTAAAGTINVTTGVELTLDTLMHIGSITKVFNATLVMQLVDEGKVNLDERVVRYLPDLQLKDRTALERITVKMLLNHTSGIDGATLPDQGHDEETIEKAIARFAALGQIHDPGAEFSYCNAGTVIAGYLAQRLTGESWYRLVRERIFKPLGMNHAATLPEEALLHRASVGHFLNAQGSPARTSHAFLPLSFGPCGRSLMMSASDLITFARAHMDNGVGPNGARILSERSTKAMRQITVKTQGKGYIDFDVGIGWMTGGEGLLMHAGGGPGIVSVLYVHPGQEFAAAILTNAAHGLRLINEFMEPRLAELGTCKPYGMTDVELPSQPFSVDVERYVGIYEDIVTCYRVSARQGKLCLSQQSKFAVYDDSPTDPTAPVALVALADGRFLIPSAEKDEERWCNANRIVTFRNPDARGVMRYLATGMRLFPRVS